MAAEPDIKRAVSFIDGQNLYRHAKDAFGHHHPNYDPRRLANAVCADCGWVNHGVRFYTGVPSADRAPMWHGYWTRRLTAMRRAGIVVTSRHLRYRVERVRLPDGSVHEVPVEREKGIDLRLGLDVVRMARNAELDVAIVFSQDQDLAEVAGEVRDISRGAERWLKVVSAFPHGPNATSSRARRHRFQGLPRPRDTEILAPIKIRGFIFTHASGTVPRHAVLGVGVSNEVRARQRPRAMRALARAGSRAA